MIMYQKCSRCPFFVDFGMPVEVDLSKILRNRNIDTADRNTYGFKKLLKCHWWLSMSWNPTYCSNKGPLARSSKQCAPLGFTMRNFFSSDGCQAHCNVNAHYRSSTLFGLLFNISFS